MSRAKRPLRITVSNRACFPKMAGCEFQEVLYSLKRGVLSSQDTPTIVEEGTPDQLFNHLHGERTKTFLSKVLK